MSTESELPHYTAAVVDTTDFYLLSLQENGRVAVCEFRWDSLDWPSLDRPKGQERAIRDQIHDPLPSPLGLSPLENRLQ